MLDITERKRAEKTLHETELKFRTVFEKIAIGVAITDLEGRVVESNRALQEMLEYSEEELRLRTFTDFTYLEDASSDIELYRELLAGRRDHYETEKRYIRRGGGLVWNHLNVSLVRSAEGEPQFVVHMVGSNTESLESQKMETVGRVTGDIAHGFNNLLATIKGYSQISLLNLKEGDPFRINLEEISKATERAEDLTHQLLTFSRSAKRWR